MTGPGCFDPPAEGVRPLPFVRPEGPVPGFLSRVSAGLFDSLRDDCLEWLAPSELEEFQRLENGKRRLSFLCGRRALKIAARAYLGEGEFRDLETVSAILEYPILRSPHLDRPDLTLSHANRGAIAISTRAGHVTGCDVEYLDESRLKVFQRALSEAEIAGGNASTSELEHAVALWAMKEALSKAVKCGFTVPFSILETAAFESDGPDRWRCIFRFFGQYRGQAWKVDDHVIAIVQPKKTVLDVPADFFRF